MDLNMYQGRWFCAGCNRHHEVEAPAPDAKAFAGMLLAILRMGEVVKLECEQVDDGFGGVTFRWWLAPRIEVRATGKVVPAGHAFPLEVKDVLVH